MEKHSTFYLNNPTPDLTRRANTHRAGFMTLIILMAWILMPGNLSAFTVENSHFDVTSVEAISDLTGNCEGEILTGNFLPPPSEEITYDNNGAGFGTPSQSINLNNFTVPAGTDRVLVISIAYGGGSNNIVSVTFAGMNATLAATRTYSGRTAQMYYLALGSGPSITGTVNATRNSTSVPFHIAAGSFSGVDQDMPVGNTGNDTENNTSITLSKEASSIIVDYYYHQRSSTPVATAGQTFMAHVNAGHDSRASFLVTDATSATVTYTGQRRGIHLAVELRSANSCIPDPAFENCPQNIEVCGAQNVSWIPPTAVDECGTPEVSASHTPGSFFEVGNHMVTYSVVDFPGVNCVFNVKVNALPDAIISQQNLPEWCQGVKVLSPKLLNMEALAMPLSFEWSNDLGNASKIVALENGDYSVKIIDGNNCSATFSTTVDEDLSTLISAHTLITEEEIEFENSEVLTGGVGLLDGDEVTVQDNTDIYTFVRSSVMDVDGTSSVNEYIDSDSPISLPYFVANPYHDNNTVNVPMNGSMTLSGTNYGNVIVGKNATLNISSDQIYMKNLTLKAGASLNFNQATDVMVKKKVKIGQQSFVNVDGPTTVFYVGDEVSVKAGAMVSVHIYAQDELEVNDSGSGMATYMTGMFISTDKIVSEDNVIWNWNINCTALEYSEGVGALAQDISQGQIAETSVEKGDFSVFPNPSDGRFNLNLTAFFEQPIDISIYNSIGELIYQKHIENVDSELEQIDISQFSNGIYFVAINANGTQTSKQVIITK